MQYALTLVLVMQTNSPVLAVRTSKRYILSGMSVVPSSTTWYGQLQGIRDPAVVFHWGAKEYFVSHAVLGGLLSFTRGLFTRNSCVAIGVERAPGNTVERERLVFCFRELAWVNVCFEGDFTITVGGAKECVQQASGPAEAQCHVLSVASKDS